MCSTRIAVVLLILSCTAPATFAAISSPEREALTALYNVTGGASWIRHDGWLGLSGSECTWRGVTCNEAGTAVTGLDLHQNNLRGSLPPQIGLLLNLETLDLSDNDLSGAIPGEIEGLTSIVSIDLWQNTLSGPVIPQFGKLITLRHLDLATNNLSGTIPTELRALTNLEYLDLGSNSLTGTIPKELSEMRRLQILALYRNQLSGAIPDELWTMTSLTELWVNGNNLTGPIPPAVGNLVNLRYLVGWGNQLSGPIPPELTALVHLTAIGLSQNNLSGEIPSQIGNLEQLQFLYLDGNLLTGTIPDSIRNLPDLQELDLSANDLSGDLPPWLTELKNLTRLALGGNQISGPIPPSIGDLSELTYLDLGNLTGSIPPSLFSLTKLQTLSLHGSGLSGSLSPAIGNLTELKSLSLGHSRLSGAVPLEIGKLTKLTFLSLLDAEFTGPLPDTIGNLQQLQGLFLGWNELSGEVPPGLWTLTKLQSLGLDHNHLEGTLPPEVGAMADLDWLSLRENRLSGPLPGEIGNLTNLNNLDLSRNAFRGVIPHEITRLTSLWDSFGLDISDNALVIDDPAVQSFVYAKDSSAEEFPSQTLTPANVRVTGTTDRTATLAWDKVAYWWSNGGIQVAARTSADGPIASIVTTVFKSDTSVVVRNLDPGTTYYFTATSVTEPYFSQQNLLLSDPSPAVSAATGPRVLGPPEVEETEGPRGLVQVDGVAENEDRVVLTNYGDQPTMITMDLHAAFATIEPATFALDAGASQTITIKSLPQPPGSYSGYAIAQGNGAYNYIWITLLSVAKPAGVALAEAVNSRVEVAGAPGSDSVGQARFRNIGASQLVGMLISDQPWLVPDITRVFIDPGFVAAVNFHVIRARRPAGVEGALTANLSLIYVANPFAAKVGSHGGTSGVSITKVTVVDVSKPAVSGGTIPPGGDVALFLPGVASFEKDGRSFVSDVSLLNESGAQALSDVRLYYTPAAAASTTVATLGAIPSTNSVTLANIVTNVYGAGSGIGSLQIRSAFWQDLVVHATLLGLAPGGTVARNIPTFRSDRSIAAGEKVYLIGVQKSGQLETNLYVQETAGLAASATVVFLDPDGSALGQSRDISVGAFGMTELDDVVPQGAVTAVVTNKGAGRLAGYGRVFGNGGENWTVVDWSAVEGFKVGSAMRVPYVSSAGGSARGRRRVVPHDLSPQPATDLLLFNPSDDDVEAVLQIIDANGASAESRILVPPHHTRIVADVGAGFTTGNAQAVITPVHGDALLATARIAGSNSEMTVPVVPETAGLRLGRSQIFAGLEDSTSATIAAAVPGTFRTSLGLVETSGAPVTARVRVILDEGRSLANSAIYRDFTLSGGQQIVVTDLVRAIVGASRDTLGDLHNLQLRIEVIGGSGSLTPFVIRTDNATGDSLLRLE